VLTPVGQGDVFDPGRIASLDRLNFASGGQWEIVWRPCDKNLTLVNAPELDRHSHGECSSVKADIADVYVRYLDDDVLAFARIGWLVVDSLVRA